MPNGISRVPIDSFKSVVIVWYTYIETISPSTILDYILIFFFHDRSRWEWAIFRLYLVKCILRYSLEYFKMIFIRIIWNLAIFHGGSIIVSSKLSI